MRLLTLSLLLLVLVLVVFAPVQNVESVDITGTFSIEDLICNDTSLPWGYSEYNFEILLEDVVFTTDDGQGGPPNDMFWVVIYDAYGNPLTATGNTIYDPNQTSINVSSFQNWVISHGSDGRIFSGLVSAQAYPFIAKLYDTDPSTIIIENVWDVIVFPEVAISEPYMPIFPDSGCGELPIGDPYNFIVGVPSLADITSETGISSSASDLAVYTSDSGDGLDLYGINAESDGFYLGTITQDMIAPYAETPPEENTLIESFGDDVNVYVLATGEIQINVGPNEEGKTFVYIFDGIPWTSITTYVIDPPLPE